MPAIAATDFGALAVLAERWARRVDRAPTLQLTNQQRRENPSAAAAYAIRTFQNRPFLEACRCCGRWTASWCEGCYAVAATNPAWEFSAVCTECDSEKLVCPRCRHHAITWTAGHDAYKSFFQEETAAEIQVEPTGDGTWVATAIRSPRARQAGTTAPETGTSGRAAGPGAGP